jgi:hypothetical protein
MENRTPVPLNVDPRSLQAPEDPPLLYRVLPAERTTILNIVVAEMVSRPQERNPFRRWEGVRREPCGPRGTVDNVLRLAGITDSVGEIQRLTALVRGLLHRRQELLAQLRMLDVIAAAFEHGDDPRAGAA